MTLRTRRGSENKHKTKTSNTEVTPQYLILRTEASLRHSKRQVKKYLTEAYFLVYRNFIS